MGIALTTAGVTFGYAVETSKGVRPTTGYKLVPDILSTPDFNVSPEILDTTKLSETKNKTGTPGLTDYGGAVEFEALHTTELMEVWDELIEAYEAAKAEDKSVWFEIIHPDLPKSECFTGIPSKMGLGAMAVNEVLKTKLYVAITGSLDWYDKSTAA